MKRPASDVAFSEAVKHIQSERGSRAAYARLERKGGFASKVDEQLRHFLETVDTAFLATASADGQPYVQHRGGPKGFIRALDEQTLGFADFVGNRQYISTGNLSENDRVCLLLFDPEWRMRVKVWGTARVVSLSDALAKLLVVEGYRARPEQAILVTVRAWDANCPQHIAQRFSAEAVARKLRELQERIEVLEAENQLLRASANRTV
jgi:predicted pyridoxine 5'-phosphate oxidase superfamily flavin-nucleotide-binding protein